MNVHIRVATNEDRDDIRDVHQQAFPEGEGRLISEFAGKLLDEQSDPATINLVAEAGGEVVGHIAFSPAFALLHKSWLGYILAPLAVRPKHRGMGVGSKLVESGIERLSERGANLLFVYGDPKYYGRFGFEAEKAANFLPPYALKYPFGWQAAMLNAGGGNQPAIQLSLVPALHDPALW